jgi:hypothetical protein
MICGDVGNRPVCALIGKNNRRVMKPLSVRLPGGNATSILIVVALLLMTVFLFVFNKTTFFSGMKLDEVTSTLSRTK